MAAMRKLGSLLPILLIAATAAAAPPSRQSTVARSATPPASGAPVAFAPGELLVRFRASTSTRAAAQAHARHGARVIARFRSVADLERVRLPDGVTVEEAAASYAADPLVLYAEPNYVVEPNTLPDDPSFAQLWGLHNVGQEGGTADADIDAPEAWDLTTGSSSVIVAVIDTGMDVDHPDLTANLFVNPSECTPNGLDDDGNGVVDDCHGFDAIDDDGRPEPDDEQHATHVAGTIGARGNDALGVVGVNWNVRIMPCRFIDDGFGRTSDAIRCLDYVASMKDLGHDIVATNNSWGGGGFSRALLDAVDEQRARGILFVAAAGNAGTSLAALYPAAFYLPNVLSVAATTRNDALAVFSNFGETFVHLGAPGQAILSTVPGGGYATFNGTSMAAPHVSGVAALLKAQDPGRDWRAIRNLLLTGGDTIPALAETITGKRLNARGSLACSGSSLARRLRPLYREVTVAPGQGLPVAALHATCADPAGDVTVTVAPGADLVLHDDGAGFDQVAGDAVYSGTWTAPASGTYTLTIAGDEVVVHVGSALVNPSPDASEAYGFAIAANDQWIVVGEPYGNAGAPASGDVQVLDATTGAPVLTLQNPSPDKFDFFGAAVAVDGNFVLVGAPYDDTHGEDGGLAYLFDATTGALLQTFASPTFNAFSNTGYAVAFVDHRVLIGAPLDSTYVDVAGTVHLFDPFSGALLHTFQNPDLPHYGDAFGFTLAARGTQAVIAALGQGVDEHYGMVHVMEADPVSPNFGSRVLSFQGVPSGKGIGRSFGYAMTVLGNDIVVGDPSAVTNPPKGFEGPGGRPISGVAYVVDGVSGAVKTQIDLPEYVAPPSFGWAVAAHGDYILVTAFQDPIVLPGPVGTGIPFAGAAYLFEASTGEPIRKFTTPVAHFADYFGYAAAAVGGDFLIGAIFDDTLGLDAGMVYRVSPPVPVARAKCYQAKVPSGSARLPDRDLVLADAIETKVTSVRGVAAACGPASLAGSAVPDPGAYLTCRKIKDAAGQPKLAARVLRVLGPLGLRSLTIKKAESLCLASGRDGSAIPGGLDHYKCYQAKTTSGTAKFAKRVVALTDEIESKSTSVVKPVAVCLPVTVDGSSIVVPDTVLTCYQIKDVAGQAPFARPSFDATQVLGTEHLATIKARTVCVPSQLLP